MSDFGLSKCVPNYRVEVFVDHGTRGFMAPETLADERVNPFKVKILTQDSEDKDMLVILFFLQQIADFPFF